MRYGQLSAWGNLWALNTKENRVRFAIFPAASNNNVERGYAGFPWVPYVDHAHECGGGDY